MDERAQGVIALINARTDMYTTSRCGGRQAGRMHAPRSPRTHAAAARGAQRTWLVSGRCRLPAGHCCALLCGTCHRAPRVCPCSCSGRISVLAEPTALTRAQGKKGGEWVHTTHDEACPEEVLQAVRGACASGARARVRAVQPRS